MSWNYRTGFRTVSYSVVDDNDHKLVVDTLEETQYGLVETYYNDDGEITFTSENFIEPYGETLEGLKWCFEKMKEAFDKEVIDLDNTVYSDYWTNNYIVLIDYLKYCGNIDSY